MAQGGLTYENLVEIDARLRALKTQRGQSSRRAAARAMDVPRQLEKLELQEKKLEEDILKLKVEMR